MLGINYKNCFLRIYICITNVISLEYIYFSH